MPTSTRSSSIRFRGGCSASRSRSAAEADIVDQRTGRREPSLCNALILAEPGAEFGRIWAEQMAEHSTGRGVPTPRSFRTA